jgi:hypothetical protein
MIDHPMPLALGAWVAIPDAPVLCPACGGARVHPIRVEVDRGGDVVEVDAAGVGFATRPRTARGVVINVELVGECGHYSALRLAFHEGTTYVTVVPLGAGAGATTPAVIWRD